MVFLSETPFDAEWSAFTSFTKEESCSKIRSRQRLFDLLSDDSMNFFSSSTSSSSNESGEDASLHLLDNGSFHNLEGYGDSLFSDVYGRQKGIPNRKISYCSSSDDDTVLQTTDELKFNQPFQTDLGSSPANQLLEDERFEIINAIWSDEDSDKSYVGERNLLEKHINCRTPTPPVNTPDLPPPNQKEVTVDFTHDHPELYFCPNEYAGKDGDTHKWRGMKVWTTVNPMLKEVILDGCILEKINRVNVQHLAFEEISAMFKELNLPYSLTMKFPSDVHQIKMADLSKNVNELASEPAPEQTEAKTLVSSKRNIPKGKKDKPRFVEKKSKKRSRKPFKKKRMNVNESRVSGKNSRK